MRTGRQMAMGLSGFLHKGRSVSEWFGRHQNRYLQLGIAGFIIAGVHLGADRIDDGCFAVLGNQPPSPFLPFAEIEIALSEPSASVSA